MKFQCLVMKKVWYSFKGLSAFSKQCLKKMIIDIISGLCIIFLCMLLKEIVCCCYKHLRHISVDGDE